MSYIDEICIPDYRTDSIIRSDLISNISVWKSIFWRIKTHILTGTCLNSAALMYEVVMHSF